MNHLQAEYCGKTAIRLTHLKLTGFYMKFGRSRWLTWFVKVNVSRITVVKQQRTCHMRYNVASKVMYSSAGEDAANLANC